MKKPIFINIEYLLTELESAKKTAKEKSLTGESACELLIKNFKAKIKK